MKVDKVYLISKCQLKPANKQFSSIKNDYEMTFNNDTVVQECANTDDDIPAVQYSFVPIQQIQSMEPNAVLGKYIETISILMSKPSRTRSI